MGQTFYRIDTDIRRQFNYLIILRFSDAREVKAVLTTYSLGLTAQQLSDLYEDATREQFSFLKIDLITADVRKKYSKGFLQFY